MFKGEVKIFCDIRQIPWLDVLAGWKFKTFQVNRVWRDLKSTHHFFVHSLDSTDSTCAMRRSTRALPVLTVSWDLERMVKRCGRQEWQCGPMGADMGEDNCEMSKHATWSTWSTWSPIVSSRPQASSTGIPQGWFGSFHSSRPYQTPAVRRPTCSTSIFKLGMAPPHRAPSPGTRTAHVF